MRLVGYLRVSSDTQLDGYGLDVQRKGIKAWAKAHSHRIIGEHSDEGLSGALEAYDRPGLTAALNAVRDRAAEGIVVARLDRLARALTVQEATLAIVWQAGGRVFAVDQGEVRQNDPDDPMRDAMRQMVGVFAELDRKLVVKRLRDGRTAKAALGKKATGEYPYGYMGAGRGRDRDAVPHPEEQKVVATIVALRRSGASYRAIAAALDADGLKPRRAASWSAMSVRAVAMRSGIT